MSRPFDLKAALSGEPVISTGGTCNGKYVFEKTWTHDGHTVLKFVATSDSPNCCEFNATLEGKSAYFPNEAYQLHMAPRKVKKTVFCPVWKTDSDDLLAGDFYDRRDDVPRASNLRGILSGEIEVEE